MPSWARGSSYPWGVYSNCQEHISSPLECTRWCIRYQIFLPKFPQVYIINLLCYMSLISCLTTPFPCSSIIFCGKRKNKNKANKKKKPKNEQTEKPTGRTMFAPDHTLTSSLCVSASSADTKTFNASLLTTCTWLKSQHTILWSLLCYSFASLQWQWISVPLDYWKLQRTRGMFCRKQWCFGEKKKERH